MSIWSPSYSRIDRTTVGDIFESNQYVNKLGEQADKLMGIDSSYNDQLRQEMEKSASENMWQQDSIANRQFARSNMSGQSGILNALKAQNSTNNSANMYQAYQNALGANMDKGMTLLNQAAGFDLARAEAEASAYGQNITNKNNFNAMKTGNAYSLLGGIGAASIMKWSDKRLKENIKKIGTSKTKSGKKVNLYSYNFKGSNKKNIGVLAQEVAKSHPKAVSKNKNGVMKVNYKRLFG